MGLSPESQERGSKTGPGTLALTPSGEDASLDRSPSVVIAGGGFGGIEVARALQDSPARVTVIDLHNYTLFQPLLYQVATAALSPTEVAVPIRGLLQSPNTEILLDEVVGLDLDRSYVRTLAGGKIDFSYLVLATGSQYNYFGHDEWERFAPAPKTLEDAVAVRRRLLLAL